MYIESDTWRTEISKYPEEKKSKEIPSVVMSDSGTGQCIVCNNLNCMERQTI